MTSTLDDKPRDLEQPAELIDLGNDDDSEDELLELKQLISTRDDQQRRSVEAAFRERFQAFRHRLEQDGEFRKKVLMMVGLVLLVLFGVIQSGVFSSYGKHHVSSLNVFVIGSGTNPDALATLLESVANADYEDDDVQLHVVIGNADGHGSAHSKSLSVANSFGWKHGAKNVTACSGNINHVLLSAWQPSASHEKAVFLEETFVVSPLYYRWVKNAWHHYGERPDVAGISLEYLGSAVGLVEDPDMPFAYNHIGRHGFSPAHQVWTDFLYLEHEDAASTTESIAEATWNDVLDGYCMSLGLYTIYLNSNSGTLESDMTRSGHVLPLLERRDWLDTWSDLKAEELPFYDDFPFTGSDDENELHSHDQDKLSGEKIAGSEVKMYRYPTLLEKALRLSQDEGYVVLQVLNMAYLELTKNWICNVKDMENVLQRTLFVATDHAVYLELHKFASYAGVEINLHTQQFESYNEMQSGGMDFYTFTLFRASMVSYLVDNGVSVLVTEADATWFGNPLQTLFNVVDESSDIALMSEDYRTPNLVNGGFVWLRSTPATQFAVQEFYKMHHARVQKLRTIPVPEQSTSSTKPSGPTPTSYDVSATFDEQSLWNDVITKSSNLHNLRTQYLDSASFASALWYSRFEAIPTPTVVLNNRVSGLLAKIERAKNFNWWWVSEDQTECSMSSSDLLDPSKLLATSNNHNWDALLQKARQIAFDGVVFVQVIAGKNMMSKVLTWVSKVQELPKDYAKAVLGRTLFVFRSAGMHDSFMSANQVKNLADQLNVYLDTNPLENLDIYRASVLLMLHRDGLSPLLQNADTGLFVDPLERLSDDEATEGDVVVLDNSPTKPRSEWNLGFIWFRQTPGSQLILEEFVQLAKKAVFQPTVQKKSMPFYLAPLFKQSNVDVRTVFTKDRPVRAIPFGHPSLDNNRIDGDGDDNSAMSSETFSNADIKAVGGDDMDHFSSNDLVKERVSFTALAEEAKSVEKDGMVIIQLLNHAYVGMTKQWICNVKEMPNILDRTLFICTDAQAQEELEQFGREQGIELHTFTQLYETKSEMVIGFMDYYLFMLFRTTVLYSLLDGGANPFLTESDSAWFGNPIEAISSQIEPNTDLVVLRDEYKNAQSLNGGFLYLRNTPTMKRIINRMYKMQFNQLQRLKNHIAKDNTEGDHRWISDKGNEQLMWRKILGDMRADASQPTPNILYLDTKLFASGQWYTRRNTFVEPYVVLNNYLKWNEAKSKRAQDWGFWWLDKEEKKCLPTPAFPFSAADAIATKNGRSFETMLQLAEETVQEDDNGDRTILVQVVDTQQTASFLLHWLKRNRKNVELLQRVLFICRDKKECAPLVGRLKKEKLDLHVYTDMVSSKSMSPYLYRAVVLHILLRNEFSPLLMQAELDVFDNPLDHIPQQYLEDKTLTILDVLQKPKGMKNDLDMVFRWFKSSPEMRTIMATYLLNLSKNLSEDNPSKLLAASMGAYERDTAKINRVRLQLGQNKPSKP